MIKETRTGRFEATDEIPYGVYLWIAIERCQVPFKRAITMKCPIYSVLRNSFVYLEQHVPLHCLHCALKLPALWLVQCPSLSGNLLQFHVDLDSLIYWRTWTPVKPLLEDFVARFVGGELYEEYCSSTRLVALRTRSDGWGGSFEMWNGVLLVWRDVLWISSMNKNKVNFSIVWSC